jgi:hypothetical protein
MRHRTAARLDGVSFSIEPGRDYPSIMLPEGLTLLLARPTHGAIPGDNGSSGSGPRHR